MSILLETPRLLFRTWTDADEEPFHEICSDPLVMRFISDGTPWSMQQVTAFIEDSLSSDQQHGFCRWPLILKQTRKLIGFCGFVPSKDGAEIGWRLAAQHWGQGLATEAAQAVLTYGFESLGFERVTATVQAGNSASLRIVEKLGLRRCGRMVRDGREVLTFATTNLGHRTKE